MDNSEFYEKEQKNENIPRKGKGRTLFVVLISVFCLVIFGGGISFFTGEDKAFSESENRVLAAMPSLSLYSLKEGTFMKDFETYLTDQFVFRDRIVELKTLFDRMTGKTKAGGVYIGKDGYLFSVPSSFDETGMESITAKISAFADSNKDSRITFMMSPNSSFVYADKLPDKLSLADQSYQIEDIENFTQSKSIDFINLSDVFLSKKDEVQLFYRTDHHWTTQAAKIAFDELMNRWKKPVKDVNFRFMAAADGFQGTLSSKSGVSSAADVIEICVPQNSAQTYVVDYGNGEKKAASLFDSSKLETKNKYEVFMGGNYGRVTVETTSSEKDTLLIIKDSYANCMLPMFTPFFSKIVVIDPRYSEERISAVTEENTFTHILFLYNLDTFLGDTSLEEKL
ncbi:MAG: hypothetical protein IJN88_01545 [Clostridia bacterium]|nr:hypothetical protein [Clostridia bacterium]